MGHTQQTLGIFKTSEHQLLFLFTLTEMVVCVCVCVYVCECTVGECHLLKRHNEAT